MQALFVTTNDIVSFSAMNGNTVKREYLIPDSSCSTSAKSWFSNPAK